MENKIVFAEVGKGMSWETKVTLMNEANKRLLAAKLVNQPQRRLANKK